MSDYISREAAVEKITFLCELREIVCNPDDEFLRGLKNALNAVKSNELIPSADVQPVRYGRWVECCNELDKKCSCCDKVHGTIYEREPFCPNCGARMDLKDGDTVTQDRCGNYMDCDGSCFIDDTPCDCDGNIEKCKVESCIKTPKRDKPLYTMEEICKMNGVESNPRLATTIRVGAIFKRKKK